MSSADKLAHTFLEITPRLMKKDLLLAIDVGTGSVRAALVTSSGTTLAFAAKEHEQIVPRFGWSQQSPQTWWEGAIFSIRSVIAQVDSAAERIAGIAACGQNHGSVLIDDAGELVLKEVPLWNDKRTRQIVDTFLREQDTDALLSIAANPPTVAWPAFKLVWIKQNEPKAYEAARTLLMPKDYINFKLTGERTIDLTEASCSYLFDARTKNWSTNILDLLGLDPRKLPRLSPPCEILGVTTAEAARATGLLAGTPVTVSAGDFPVALLGAGVTRPGMGCDLTGTSTLIALLAEEAVLDPLITNIQGIIGGWAAFTIVDAGGDAMRWARRAFHDKADSYEQIIRLAGSVPPGSDKLLFLPYLNGERLARKANSRAQFFGLTSGHGAGHLHRAVMEGVAFASRRNIELMQSKGNRLERMVAAAGGAKSCLWLEIKASIYNCPMLTLAEPECGILGCAMLSGVTAGLFSNLHEAVAKLVRYDREILPNPEWVDRYQRMQALFNDLYESSEQFWDRFDQL
jgi:xylulokinase